MEYTAEQKDKASLYLDREFNQIQFENVRKIIGEDSWFDYIIRPSDKILEEETKDSLLKGEWEKMNEIERSEAIETYYSETEHCPIWNTLFEAKNEFMGKWIEKNADKLYKIGIGVISSTDTLNAMMFISGCGYSFYDAHWIPLFILKGWIEK